MATGFRVDQQIDGASVLMPGYPLLKGDLIVPGDDGTYVKVAPGLMIGGFVLTPEQVATLAEVEYTASGLLYAYPDS